MPSFDIVSEVDLHQFSNAIDQASRIIDTRFDFKGVDAKFERSDLTVTLLTDSDFQIKQMKDMLRTALVKNKIDAKAMQSGNIASAGKGVKVVVTMQNGVETDMAKEIIKLIKDKKLKVQSQIQDGKIRVTGKKRDDLQQVMAILREADFDVALQFNNFRD